MNRRAKIVTLSAMTLGLAVLVVGAVALSDPIAEWWYIRQVKLGDPEAKETAARKITVGDARVIWTQKVADAESYSIGLEFRELPVTEYRMIVEYATTGE